MTSITITLLNVREFRIKQQEKDSDSATAPNLRRLRGATQACAWVQAGWGGEGGR